MSKLWWASNSNLIKFDVLRSMANTKRFYTRGSLNEYKDYTVG